MGKGRVAKADEFKGYDAIGLGELVIKKEVKPTELLGVAIHRIERINPNSGSWIIVPANGSRG